MIVVIFESWPAEGRAQKYLDMAETLRPHLDGFDGFISIERFRALLNRGSYWHFRSGEMKQPFGEI
jgi:heme-degrading monooxygenase HmoA